MMSGIFMINILTKSEKEYKKGTEIKFCPFNLQKLFTESFFYFL